MSEGADEPQPNAGIETGPTVEELLTRVHPTRREDAKAAVAGARNARLPELGQREGVPVPHDLDPGYHAKMEAVLDGFRVRVGSYVNHREALVERVRQCEVIAAHNAALKEGEAGISDVGITLDGALQQIVYTDRVLELLKDRLAGLTTEKDSHDQRMAEQAELARLSALPVAEQVRIAVEKALAQKGVSP